MQEILNGVEAHSEVRAERCWKLLMLLPRLLFFRPARGGVVPRKKLEGRIRQFQEGDWISLLNDSANCAAQAKVASVRARRRDRSDEATRAARAMSLVQVGESSAARQALEGLAPGNLATPRALTDPAKRPAFPREELSVEVARVELEEPFQLDAEGGWTFRHDFRPLISCAGE